MMGFFGSFLDALKRGLGSAPARPEPKPPFLFADIYWHDEGPRPDFAVASRAVSGFILKATQGDVYAHADWFVTNWERARLADPARYAAGELLRGAYHYLELTKPAVPQADYYLRIVDKAGGWGASDIVPIVDVEGGGDGSANSRATAQQVVDCTSRWAERVTAVTGRPVMYYGRGLDRDLRINSRMGCSCVWDPAYTRRIVLNGLEEWTLNDVVLWQYTDGTAGDNSAHGLPIEIPDGPAGFGRVDLSVAICGDRRPTWAEVKRRLLTGRP
jgi:GH25 family lysozyme M1 (1,4-beta-N-acetylmuramidase)